MSPAPPGSRAPLLVSAFDLNAFSHRAPWACLIPSRFVCPIYYQYRFPVYYHPVLAGSQPAEAPDNAPGVNGDPSPAPRVPPPTLEVMGGPRCGADQHQHPKGPSGGRPDPRAASGPCPSPRGPAALLLDGAGPALTAGPRERAAPQTPRPCRSGGGSCGKGVAALPCLHRDSLLGLDTQKQDVRLSRSQGFSKAFAKKERIIKI